MALPPGLLITAPGSGCGKTTLTLGLLRALRDRGLAVQPFKCGPDYIDPGFHWLASDRVSLNLDSWCMPAATIASLLDAANDTDLVVCEGAMGLFDGGLVSGESGNGASADIAVLAGWPVVLVLDVTAQAQSAAAVALGFSTLRTDVRLAGVVLNRVASARHEALVRSAMQQVGIRVLGALPREPGMTLPERHLGLEQARELSGGEHRLTELGRFVTEHVDLDALLMSARPTAVIPDVRMTCGGSDARTPHLRPPGQRIALADDAAFSFIYPHLLEAWQAAGAEVLPFSPLADQPPDDRADVCWLPGGYPELHGGELACADRFRAGLQVFARTRPVHGECGGYMAMGEGLIDADGTTHRMAGLLGLITSFANRRLHLGYRLAELQVPVPGHAVDTRLRGHEFHYSTIVQQPDEPLAHVYDAGGVPVAESGSWRGHASGSFFHLVAEASVDPQAGTA